MAYRHTLDHKCMQNPGLRSSFQSMSAMLHVLLGSRCKGAKIAGSGPIDWPVVKAGHESSGGSVENPTFPIPAQLLHSGPKAQYKGDTRNTIL